MITKDYGYERALGIGEHRKMPHKNPRCPKCGARMQFSKSAGNSKDTYGRVAERAFYKCKYCPDVEVLDWAWERRPHPLKFTKR